MQLIRIEYGAAMTGVSKLLQATRLIRVHDDVAAKHGIELSIGFDFREYVSITQATATKVATPSIFQPDRSPIKPGEGYWIVGVDKNNDVALVEAARLYDLSHSNLAEHFESLRAFYADPAMHAHPQDYCTCTAPSARKIKGKVAYHGDLWVREDLRGRGIPKITTRVGRSVTCAMWDPDFVCWIVLRCLLDKNIHRSAHHEAAGAILRLVEQQIVGDYWLVWRTGEESRSFVDRHDRSGPIFAP
ncbi:hypothetical protein ACNJYD_08595 [Bradyrhizobium sp. DASA03005]|uniref:hypothetical protein n=1 Tax=Bradyrhizobium sp. SPXBL-02 TaxID=3395912 RepID=UPI003F730BC9